MTSSETEPVTIGLDRHLLAALDRYREGEGSAGSREAAIVHILTEWLASKGLINDSADDGGVPVDELNSANDG